MTDGPAMSAPICQCEEPKPYTRPSGQVVCLHPSCGGLILPKPEKDDRP